MTNWYTLVLLIKKFFAHYLHKYMKNLGKIVFVSSLFFDTTIKNEIKQNIVQYSRRSNRLSVPESLLSFQSTLF